MVAPIEIRRYDPSDRGGVWRLHNEALDGVGAYLGNGPWDDDLHEIEDAYLGCGAEFFVGVVDNRVVAMGTLRRVSPAVAEVKRMRVEPTLQGWGIGRALLSAMHRRALELGYTTLRLDTAVHRSAARRLYEANGYREERRGRIGPFDCVFYERRAVAS